ncbi:hypothetical protein [Sinomonas gamaensis]|uniref:hypothetical protein n=1 Tax=Sinomonas gamaensis TaxID=2565624 RepID=UPI001109454B|nr:hypothetical protein [Sinomonas gamaensis]
MRAASALGTKSHDAARRLGLTVLEVVRPFELAKACWQLIEARDFLTLSYVRKVVNDPEARLAIHVACPAVLPTTARLDAPASFNTSAECGISWAWKGPSSMTERNRR